METIGAHKNIKLCLDLIDFNGASPVLNWRGALWYIHTHERHLGNLLATKFADKDTPLYSLRTPFSLGVVLGQALLSADNLRQHEAHMIDTIPEELIPLT
jgi:hypothetical protein